MNYFQEYDDASTIEATLDTILDKSTKKEYRVTKVSYYPVFEAVLTDSKSQTVILDRVEALNRAMFNDTVIYCVSQQRVTSIVNEYNPEIIGVVNSNSVVTYGENNRGLPYYLFKPVNKSYPSFIVPYDKKKNGKQDILAIVKRNNWPTSKKYPIGKIMEYIGQPGIYENEIEAILVRYDLFRKNVPNRILKEEPLKPVDFEDFVDASDDASVTDNASNNATSEVSETPKKFKDLRGKNVFSIDPENCEDIDDAIHIEKKRHNEYIIGIHIATPALFLPKDGIHDSFVKERLSSIYTPIKRIDMLHPDLAIQKSSLLKDQVRPVNSLLFTIHKEDNGYKIGSVAFEACLITNRANLSYEEAQTLYDLNKPFLSKDSNEDLPILSSLMKVTDSLARTYLPTFKNGVEDMHRLIEAWMIFANLYTGRELVKRYAGLAPLRVLGIRSTTFTSVLEAPTILEKHERESDCKTEVKEKNLEKSIVPELDKNLQNFLEIRNNNAATYQLYDPELGNDEHSALGIRQYTHFSSPIRRYFDIIVHRMLYPNIFENLKDSKMKPYQKEELQSLLTSINKKNSLIRKAERAFDRIRIVNELQKSGIYPIEIMTIIDFSRYSLELFSEKWNTVIKYKIIPRLLRKKYYINEKGFLCTDKDEKLDHKVENIQFRLFDKITIKSYPSPSGSLMELNHELIEPGFSFM